MVLDRNPLTLDPKVPQHNNEPVMELTHEQAVNNESLTHEFTPSSHGELALESFADIVPAPKRRRIFTRMAKEKIMSGVTRGVGALFGALAILGSIVGFMMVMAE
ncbi:hypothetical protein [Psittacicella hinzii]|uniref:Uncharacterized protein n=1 Tax=Psittacicella hinzii TaxID=2028575 RepID=A0A3A1YTW4_9GAMM|nr:hypothetical protein [Psittacicella hinzii]RIY40320.1 hypothetical protein CKF58_00715 [Psittacicella hinzii]